MEKHYSLAIYPSESVIAMVKSMKEDLSKKIGWFHSKNSVGHITICEFKATDKEIEIIKNQLIRLCDPIIPFDVCLNEFGSYPNGAFFIAPDEDSKKSLIPLMKKFHESLRIRSMQKSTDPHLSIARKLNPEKLTTARNLFTEINISFLCDNVVLRKFDENIKQFFVTDSFDFNSNPNSELIQGTLF
ncbi:MAG: 2'-5' RNA ligase family protein [Flavobacterium sp.]